MQVIFIHSAGAQGPGEGSSRLLQTLRTSLPEGMALRAPAMPSPDNPDAEVWITATEEAMASAGAPFILCGHSLGGSILLQALARFGLPAGLVGVVTLAAPFWGAPGWAYDDFALPPDAGMTLSGLTGLVMLLGAADDVVSADHLERYKAALPQAQTRLLPGIDHEAASAGPALAAVITAVAENHRGIRATGA